MALLTIPALLDDRYLLEQFPRLDSDVHHGFMRVPAAKSKYSQLLQYAQIVASEPGSNKFQQLAAYVMSEKVRYAARIQDSSDLNGDNFASTIGKLNDLFDYVFLHLIRAECSRTNTRFTEEQFGRSADLLRGMYTAFQDYMRSLRDTTPQNSTEAEKVYALKFTAPASLHPIMKRTQSHHEHPNPCANPAERWRPGWQHTGERPQYAHYPNKRGAAKAPVMPPLDGDLQLASVTPLVLAAHEPEPPAFRYSDLRDTRRALRAWRAEEGLEPLGFYDEEIQFHRCLAVREPVPEPIPKARKQGIIARTFKGDFSWIKCNPWRNKVIVPPRSSTPTSIVSSASSESLVSFDKTVFMGTSVQQILDIGAEREEMDKMLYGPLLMGPQIQRPALPAPSAAQRHAAVAANAPAPAPAASRRRSGRTATQAIASSTASVVAPTAPLLPASTTTATVPVVSQRGNAPSQRRTPAAQQTTSPANGNRKHGPGPLPLASPKDTGFPTTQPSDDQLARPPLSPRRVLPPALPQSPALSPDVTARTQVLSPQRQFDREGKRRMSPEQVEALESADATERAAAQAAADRAEADNLAEERTSLNQEAERRTMALLAAEGIDVEQQAQIEAAQRVEVELDDPEAQTRALLESVDQEEQAAIEAMLASTPRLSSAASAASSSSGVSSASSLGGGVSEQQQEATAPTEAEIRKHNSQTDDVRELLPDYGDSVDDHDPRSGPMDRDDNGDDHGDSDDDSDDDGDDTPDGASGAITTDLPLGPNPTIAEIKAYGERVGLDRLPPAYIALLAPGYARTLQIFEAYAVRQWEERGVRKDLGPMRASLAIFGLESSGGPYQWWNYPVETRGIRAAGEGQVGEAAAQPESAVEHRVQHASNGPQREVHAQRGALTVNNTPAHERERPTTATEPAPPRQPSHGEQVLNKFFADLMARKKAEAEAAAAAAAAAANQTDAERAEEPAEDVPPPTPEPSSTAPSLEPPQLDPSTHAAATSDPAAAEQPSASPLDPTPEQRAAQRRIDMYTSATLSQQDEMRAAAQRRLEHELSAQRATEAAEAEREWHAARAERLRLEAEARAARRVQERAEREASGAQREAELREQMAARARAMAERERELEREREREQAAVVPVEEDMVIVTPRRAEAVLESYGPGTLTGKRIQVECVDEEVQSRRSPPRTESPFHTAWGASTQHARTFDPAPLLTVPVSDADEDDEDAVEDLLDGLGDGSRDESEDQEDDDQNVESQEATAAVDQTRESDLDAVDFTLHPRPLAPAQPTTVAVETSAPTPSQHERPVHSSTLPPPASTDIVPRTPSRAPYQPLHPSPLHQRADTPSPTPSPTTTSFTASTASTTPPSRLSILSPARRGIKLRPKRRTLSVSYSPQVAQSIGRASGSAVFGSVPVSENNPSVFGSVSVPQSREMTEQATHVAPVAPPSVPAPAPPTTTAGGQGSTQRLNQPNTAAHGSDADVDLTGAGYDTLALDLDVTVPDDAIVEDADAFDPDGTHPADDSFTLPPIDDPGVSFDLAPSSPYSDSEASPFLLRLAPSHPPSPPPEPAPSVSHGVIQWGSESELDWAEDEDEDMERRNALRRQALEREQRARESQAGGVEVQNRESGGVVAQNREERAWYEATRKAEKYRMRPFESTLDSIPAGGSESSVRSEAASASVSLSPESASTGRRSPHRVISPPRAIIRARSTFDSPSHGRRHSPPASVASSPSTRRDDGRDESPSFAHLPQSTPARAHLSLPNALRPTSPPSPSPRNRSEGDLPLPSKQSISPSSPPSPTPGRLLNPHNATMPIPTSSPRVDTPARRSDGDSPLPPPEDGTPFSQNHNRSPRWPQREPLAAALGSLRLHGASASGGSGRRGVSPPSPTPTRDSSLRALSRRSQDEDSGGIPSSAAESTAAQASGGGGRTHNPWVPQHLRFERDWTKEERKLVENARRKWLREMKAKAKEGSDDQSDPVTEPDGEPEVTNHATELESVSEPEPEPGTVPSSRTTRADPPSLLSRLGLAPTGSLIGRLGPRPPPLPLSPPNGSSSIPSSPTEATSPLPEPPVSAPAHHPQFGTQPHIPRSQPTQAEPQPRAEPQAPRPNKAHARPRTQPTEGQRPEAKRIPGYLAATASSGAKDVEKRRSSVGAGSEGNVARRGRRVGGKSSIERYGEWKSPIKCYDEWKPALELDGKSPVNCHWTAIKLSHDSAP